MRFPLLAPFGVAAACALALSACQGNLGSGSGLSIPQAPAYNQPQGPNGAQAVSRQRVVEGAVYYTSPMPELPLPVSVGFAIEINLGTPGPLPTATPTPTAVPAASPKGRLATSHSRTVAHATAPHPATPLPTITPTPAPAGSADGAVVHSLSELTGSAAPATGASSAAGGSAAPGTAGPTSSPTAEPTTAPGHHPAHPSAAPSGPKITTKTVAYPDDAPQLPTPEPTGNIQTFPNRHALVLGYLLPALDVHVYGLGAVRFTVPSAEIIPGRGYTIAIFEAGKHHRSKMVDSDSQPVVSAGTIASSFLDKPIDFHKGIGYDIVLYADEQAATPAAVPSGYPPIGNNPLPLASGQTPVPGTLATPLPPGYQPTPPNPYPSQTYFR